MNLSVTQSNKEKIDDKIADFIAEDYGHSIAGKNMGRYLAIL